MKTTTRIAIFAGSALFASLHSSNALGTEARRRGLADARPASAQPARRERQPQPLDEPARRGRRRACNAPAAARRSSASEARVHPAGCRGPTRQPPGADPAPECAGARRHSAAECGCAGRDSEAECRRQPGGIQRPNGGAPGGIQRPDAGGTGGIQRPNAGAPGGIQRPTRRCRRHPATECGCPGGIQRPNAGGNGGIQRPAAATRGPVVRLTPRFPRHGRVERRRQQSASGRARSVPVRGAGQPGGIERPRGAAGPHSTGRRQRLRRRRHQYRCAHECRGRGRRRRANVGVGGNTTNVNVGNVNVGNSVNYSNNRQAWVSQRQNWGNNVRTGVGGRYNNVFTNSFYRGGIVPGGYNYYGGWARPWTLLRLEPLHLGCLRHLPRRSAGQPRNPSITPTDRAATSITRTMSSM